VKWLLILFLSIVIVPTLAQNTSINQTEYQNLNSSIYGLHSDHMQSDALAKVYAEISIAVGFLIAFVIYIAHTRQSKKIKDMIIETRKTTTEVQDMIKKQNKLIDDTRAVYAEAYVSWVQLIIISFEYVVDWYNTRYVNQPISQLRENTKSNLIDHYERDLVYRCPKVETMELVKVFGREIADEVWTSTTHMHATDWQPERDEGMALMINEYKERVKQAIDLKDTFLPFCDESTKVKDQNLKGTYDKIKATP
jgi:hypothetical protein